MTPTALGAWPSTEPLATGLRQAKAGTNPAARRAVVGEMWDSPSGGNLMRIAVTPQRDCWWAVGAHCILLNSAAAWTSCIWGITLWETDALGNEGNNQCYVRTNSALGWCGSACQCTWALAAGHAYTASMYWWQGAGIDYYPQHVFHEICGHTFGEGVR